MSFFTVNEDIHKVIFSFLSVKDLGAVLVVNKFSSYLLNNDFWRFKFIEDFGAILEFPGIRNVEKRGFIYSRNVAKALAVQYVYEYITYFEAPSDDERIVLASASGHCRLVRKLYTGVCSRLDMRASIMESCRNGHLDVLKFLSETGVSMIGISFACWQPVRYAYRDVVEF